MEVSQQKIERCPEGTPLADCMCNLQEWGRTEYGPLVLFSLKRHPSMTFMVAKTELKHFVKLGVTDVERCLLTKARAKARTVCGNLQKTRKKNAPKGSSLLPLGN